MIRTIPFQSVFDRVIRKLGRDPNAEIPQDAARAVCDHINKRVDDYVSAWRWPEWELTEERAFRQIWNTTRQYSLINSDGVPDEVFYLGDGYVPGNTATGTGTGFGANSGYYQAGGSGLADPPIGTLPTNTVYWTKMVSVEQYIEYDQPCRRSIGIVRGVFKQNPAVSNSGQFNGIYKLKYWPMEKGIKVPYTGNPTVFVTYTMPIPQYSMVPNVAGFTYNRGDIVFDPATGECFQALASTSDPVNNIASWRRVPFLARWANMVVEGAFSDALYEFDQGGNDDIQQKQILAERADQKAMEALLRQTDELQSQGQTLKWERFRRQEWSRDCWCDSITWDGSGSVSTLVADCESDLGWVYPIPVVQPAQFSTTIPFYINVLSLKTTTPTLIATVSTKNMATGQIVAIETGQLFRLDAGVGDLSDPGQGQPADYSATTNNRHWTQLT